MSQNIYYRPRKSLSCLSETKSLIDLKTILIEKYGYEFDIQKTDETLAYFEGLIDAKVEGAKDLLDLIEKFSDIEIVID